MFCLLMQLLDNKLLHKVIVRMMDNLLGCAELGNLSLMDNQDFVRERQRLLRVMRYNDRGQFEFSGNRLNPLLDRLLDHAVQRAERLVERQDLRFRNQRSGQGHSLLLPARQFADPLVQVGLKLQKLDIFLYLLLTHAPFLLRRPYTILS